MQPLDLGDLARNVVQDWVQASFAHRIDLGYEAPPEPLTITGNPTMLRELLSNLIDNALRYTPAAAASPCACAATSWNTPLEVEDTGPGIAPAERERVFERFYRILGNTAEGSGLGLAIVREIAQQHGAEVDIFNNPRATQPKLPGALFRLTFPLPPAPPKTKNHRTMDKPTRQHWRARRLTVALLRCGC
jgi:two-component system sensor histidine kinase TctE